jgi:hypothetical protein
LELDQALQRFMPGAELDAPGTDINAALWARILRAVARLNQPPAFGEVFLARAHFIENVSFMGVQFSENAQFIGAQFSGDASFDNAQFSKNARFGGVRFKGNVTFIRTHFNGKVSFDEAEFIRTASFNDAHFSNTVDFSDARFRWYSRFDGVHFQEYAYFIGAQFVEEARFARTQFGEDANFIASEFSKSARFIDTQFSGVASFSGAQFNKHADFQGAQFNKDASFGGAQFSGVASFDGTQFNRDAQFNAARFEKAASIGPMAAGSVIFDRTVFVRPVVIEVAAVSVSCLDVTWEAGVTLRLRYAQVNLERATFSKPSFVVGADQPFVLKSFIKPLNESEIVSRARAKTRASDDPWIPILTSIRDADAFNLSVTDVDLSQCGFAGARLLDQLRLEGRCIFDHPPKGFRAGWTLLPLWRWSSRQSLAEERVWRATTPKYSGWAAIRSSESAEVRPERLAALYRQLRKAQEDAKNEPGAADFYYGEMEMRRHARSTPVAEHYIVWLYWLISGYGLRALRSLAALVMLGVIVSAVLVGWGLAATTPSQHLTGTVITTPQHLGRIDATLGETIPQLPRASQRWTRQRIRTALEVTLESIVFRSTDQPLTSTGIWTTDAARILGPVLLALTLLAARNRVKR